jgi:hypothetical protein
MTRAGKRLSTPRRTASKIKPKPIASNEDRAEAFLDLELPMHELYCIAEIAEAVFDKPEINSRRLPSAIRSANFAPNTAPAYMRERRCKHERAARFLVRADEAPAPISPA